MTFPGQSSGPDTLFGLARQHTARAARAYAAALCIARPPPPLRRASTTFTAYPPPLPATPASPACHPPTPLPATAATARTRACAPARAAPPPALYPPPSGLARDISGDGQARLQHLPRTTPPRPLPAAFLLPPGVPHAPTRGQPHHLPPAHPTAPVRLPRGNAAMPTGRRRAAYMARGLGAACPACLAAHLPACLPAWAVMVTWTATYLFIRHDSVARS